MIEYARAAVSWRLVAACCATMIVMMVLVAFRPYIFWPLHGMSLVVILAAVAWSNDERCAALVDTLPRGLAWRTAARAGAVPAVLALWGLCIVLGRDRLPDHLPLFLLQGVAAVTVALAVTVTGRARGVAEPGKSLAIVAVPIVTALALVRPVPEWIPLFPVWPDEEWGRSWVLWIALTASSLLVLTVSLSREVQVTSRPVTPT